MLEEAPEDLDPFYEPGELPEPHLEHLQEPRPARSPLGTPEPTVEVWWLASQQWAPRVVEAPLPERSFEAASVQQSTVPTFETEEKCRALA